MIIFFASSENRQICNDQGDKKCAERFLKLKC